MKKTFLSFAVAAMAAMMVSCGGNTNVTTNEDSTAVEVEEDAEVLLEVHGHEDRAAGFACDGVAEVASVDGSDAQVGVVHERVEQSHEDLVGVAATLVDILAGVSAHKSAHFDLRCEITFG